MGPQNNLHLNNTLLLTYFTFLPQLFYFPQPHEVSRDITVVLFLHM